MLQITFQQIVGHCRVLRTELAHRIVQQASLLPQTAVPTDVKTAKTCTQHQCDDKLNMRSNPALALQDMLAEAKKRNSEQESKL